MVDLEQMRLPDGTVASGRSLELHFRSVKKVSTIFHLVNGIFKASFEHPIRVNKIEDIDLCLKMEGLPSGFTEVLEVAKAKFEEINMLDNLTAAVHSSKEEDVMQLQEITALSISNGMLGSIKVSTGNGIVIIKQDYTVEVGDNLVVTTPTARYTAPLPSVVCFGMSSPKLIKRVCDKCRHFNAIVEGAPFIIPYHQCSNNEGTYRLQLVD